MNTEQNCCPIHDDTHFCRYKVPGLPNSNCQCVCTCSRTEQNNLSFVDPDGFKKADETLKYGEVPTEQKCDKCLAHNIGNNHVCPPLMRALKENYDKKQGHTEQKGWREGCCNRELPDGSICRVKLDCHLHDWRQKEALLAYQEELEKKIAGAGRIYGERPYMWPLQAKETFATEDFDGTNERQWIRVWNAALSEALSLIKDTKPQK